MSRRNKAHRRCGVCLMHESLCVCDLVPRLVTRTRLTLVIHRYEARKPTNSGRLAAACLVNSEVRVRGHEGEPDAPFVWDDGVQPLVLFPAPSARPLDEFACSDRPVSLVVPDGTWRQASKVRTRIPGLADVPCVTLPPAGPTRYRLRAETHDAGLGTMEAIARAMGILEGPAIEDAMEQVFRTMVERTLWLRGELASSDVTGGIPEAARACDPRGSQGVRGSRNPDETNIARAEDGAMARADGVDR